MDRHQAALGAVLVVGVTVFGACHSAQPQSPPTGLTSAIQTPQPPDLGRGAPRFKEAGPLHLYVGDPLWRTCSGSVPFFDFDSSATREADQPSMQTLADCMTKGPLTGRSIKLIGRTDPRGTTEYNDQLGLERAQEVKDWLVAHGIDAGRIAVESAGESQASADPEGWPKDRRVEIRLVR